MHLEVTEDQGLEHFGEHWCVNGVTIPGFSESGMLSSSTTALQTCWIQILRTSPPCLRYVWAAASRDLQTCPILDLSGHQQSPHSKNEH